MSICNEQNQATRDIAAVAKAAANGTQRFRSHLQIDKREINIVDEHRRRQITHGLRSINEAFLPAFNK